MEYRKSAHSIYDIKYHLVWVTKYRKKILRGAIGERARELIRQTCKSLEVNIIKGHVSVDHVHLLMSVPPNISVSELMQRLKGRSSRRLMEEYRDLKKEYWGQHMWARGYFVASTGNVSEEVVKKYIETQDTETKDDMDFRVGDL